MAVPERHSESNVSWRLDSGWTLLTSYQSVPVLFFLLFCWVWELQLLMQIILNRIYVIADDKEFVKKLKIGTAVIITAINIAVFVIWIPAHLNPPVNSIFVNINKYWDRLGKILVCLVDTFLNYYFLRTVRLRLLCHPGLAKYKPLVSFNSMLMCISISMDILLVGLMSLPNHAIYVQYHPVVYLVKLNIEMSMAAMIAKLAQDGSESRSLSYASEFTDIQSKRPSSTSTIDSIYLHQMIDTVQLNTSDADRFETHALTHHNLENAAEPSSHGNDQSMIRRTDLQVATENGGEKSSRSPAVWRQFWAQ